MNSGNPKVLLHLELANKLKGGFAKAKNYVNSNIKEMQGRINSLKTQHLEAFKEMTDRVPGLGDAVGMLKNPYAIATVAVLALAAAYGKASAMANQFDTAFAKVNVTAKMNSGELAVAKGQVLDIAGRSYVKDAVNAAPEALGIMISGGMDKDTAMKALEPTLQAAKAGFTDIATTARAATAVMNSSGIKDATRVYDILAMTLNRGNAEFSDIANYLPKIVPGAKDAGFSLEQVAGAFAYLTAQGQTSEKAATMLENAFKALSDPDRVKAFNKIGVSIYDAAGKMRPLADIVDQLNTKLNGLNDSNKAKLLDSLGLDMEGRGAFSAMAQDAGLLRDIIGDTTNSAGELKAQLEASKTPLDAWTRITNMIDVGWIKIGESVNESLGSFMDWLEPIAEIWIPRIGEGFTFVWNTLETILSPVFKIVGGLITWIAKSELLTDIIKGIQLLFEGLTWTIGKVGDTIGWVYEHTIKPILDAIEWTYRQVKSLVTLGGSVEEVKLRDKMKSDAEDQAKAFLDKQLAFAGKEESAIQDALKKQNDPNKNFAVPTTSKKKKDSEETGTISGAKNIRQITVNIESFIKGDFVTQNQNFSQMSPRDLERWFAEMIQRSVRNLEVGYS